jgi:hypothetical protein
MPGTGRALIVTNNKRDWSRDFKLGTVFGLAIALVFSLMAAARYAIGGAQSFERTLGIELGKLTGIYFAGGLAGGLIIGLLRPLRASPWGSFVLGFFAGLPLAFGIMTATTPRHEWDFVFVVLAAILEGGGLAVFLWYRTYGWTAKE